MDNRRSTFFYGVMIAMASLVVGMVIAARLDVTTRSFAANINGPALNSAPLTGAIDASTFRTVAAQASPAVVSISVKATRPVNSNFSELFGLNGRNRGGGGGGARPRQEELVDSAGSGFVIDKAGFILTNHHVVEDAQLIEVSFADARRGEAGYPAIVVGRDELTDTALLKLTRLPATPLTEAKFGDSSQVAPGDWVMAIGNPYRLSNSVTVGVVSAVGRPYQASSGPTGSRYEPMIQTDAAINHGNSGGPLLNIRGEVVGINTMIYSDTNVGGNIGIGFAVPINRVHALLPQLHAGRVVRGRIGVTLTGNALRPEDAQDLGLPGAGGAIIASVDADGPAKTAGLRMDDVVVEFNGKAVTDNDELIAMVTGTAPGTTVPIKIVRNKKALSLSVKVEELDLAREQGQQTVRSRQTDDATPKDTGFGMTIQEITSGVARELSLPQGKGGAVVSSVDPLGPAAQQGLAAGDVILAVNGQTVTNLDEVSKALDAVGTGRLARLSVLRRGAETLFLIRKR